MRNKHMKEFDTTNEKMYVIRQCDDTDKIATKRHKNDESNVN